MEIKNPQFVKSSQKLSELPPEDKPEYAFVGRSNVGKSSLINSLCNRKQLAKTSGTPGKTQLINHFLIDDTWYIVDLPGYGYAQVSKKDRQVFQAMITDYILERESLMCVLVLVDSRLKPQQIDLEFIEFLGVHEIPFVIVFTKTDKPKKMELAENIEAFKAAMMESWEELPQMFFTSAVKGMGKEEILAYVEKVNRLY
jgi:GTP-binding protein